MVWFIWIIGMHLIKSKLYTYVQWLQWLHGPFVCLSWARTQKTYFLVLTLTSYLVSWVVLCCTREEGQRQRSMSWEEVTKCIFITVNPVKEIYITHSLITIMYSSLLQEWSMRTTLMWKCRLKKLPGLSQELGYCQLNTLPSMMFRSGSCAGVTKQR